MKEQAFFVLYLTLVLGIPCKYNILYICSMIKIMIYDDNKARRESLSALLGLTEGMTCIGIFPDCATVKNEVAALQPDVVLMDIEMPNVNGIEGVRIIKKNFPEVKIIMQTIFDDTERIFAALQAGAEGYILKNASIESITQCIEEVYQGGAYMTPSVALRVTKFFNQQSSPIVSNDSFSLTKKEKEVLSFLADGLSYKMVADKMGISYFTVNSHVKKIYEKLQVHSVGEAVSLAIKNKLV
jgi:DNA-binding NarL/FixJ family response regulator